MKWTYRNDPFKIICLNYQNWKPIIQLSRPLPVIKLNQLYLYIITINLLISPNPLSNLHTISIDSLEGCKGLQFTTVHYAPRIEQPRELNVSYNSP